MADLIYGSGGTGGGCQVKTMPTPSASKNGKIVEYVGETTSDYIKGYFYECYVSGTTPAVTESFTVTQTAGSQIEEITTSVSVFKSKLNPTGNVNVQFTCAGKPTKLSLTKESQTLALDRYTPFDNPATPVYCWKDSNNNYYYSNTELPVASTRFYLSSDDPSVPSTTDSGWNYQSTTERASTGQGVWVKDATEYVTLSEYGIYITGTGQIGDTLQAAYVYPVPAGNTYAWRRINVQPSGGAGGGIGYEDLHAISPIAYNSTSGTYSVASGYSIPTTAQTAKIDTAIQSNNVKTINGNSIIGSGDIAVKTYAPFPADFVTTGTLAQVVASIKTSSGRGTGKAYLGTISGACMPLGSGNGECKVEYMTDNIAVLTLNSSNTPPYNWVYNTDASNLSPADYTWKHYISQYENNLPTRDVPDGTIVQYAGTTNENYTKGYWYKANTVGYTCTWERWDVQPQPEKATTQTLGLVKPDGTTITIDNNGVISSQAGGSEEDNLTITKNSQDKIQAVGIIDQNSGYDKVWHGTKAQFDAITTKDNNTLYFVDDGGDIGIQVTSMPVASASYEGRVLQYVGTTDTNYTNGYWYRCGQTGGTYSWTRIDVQPSAISDVQVNGTSIVTSGVANIPVASGAPGVVAISDRGLTMAGYYASLATYQANTRISNRSTIATSGVAITSESYDFAVKAAMCDGVGEAWSSSEQTAARARMDVDQATQTATITDSTTTTLANNTVYTGSSLTAVTIAYPATPGNVFNAEVNFTTGASITFAIDANTVMKGDDCANGTFTPVANANYSIMFGYVNSTKLGVVVKI